MDAAHFFHCSLKPSSSSFSISNEEVLDAIRSSKEHGKHAFLFEIVKKHFFYEDSFFESVAAGSSKVVYKAISRLVKSNFCFSEVRPQMQKCLRLAIRHFKSLNATSEEEIFYTSKKTICFQCVDGTYSINALLFKLAFPEYWEAAVHFASSSHEQRASRSESPRSHPESNDALIHFPVASVQLLERWLLGTDYMGCLGENSIENGLDLYSLGGELLSQELQRKAFDFIRYGIGSVLDSGCCVRRSPDWTTILFAGQAMLGVKTSPFFLRLKQEIDEVFGNADIETSLQQRQNVPTEESCTSSTSQEHGIGAAAEQAGQRMLGPWTILTRDDWKLVFDYQHLKGRSFPIFRSYLDILTHRNDKSMEGAFCRALIATHTEDPQIEVCVGYTTDSRRDMLINQALHAIIADMKGAERSAFSQALISKVSEADRQGIFAIHSLFRKERPGRAEKYDVFNEQERRCVRSCEFFSLVQDHSLAGIYLQKTLQAKALRIELKNPEDIAETICSMTTDAQFREGICAIVIEHDVPFSKKFLRHPSIPESVEIFVRTCGFEQKISRDREWEAPCRSSPLAPADCYDEFYY